MIANALHSAWVATCIGTVVLMAGFVLLLTWGPRQK